MVVSGGMGWKTPAIADAVLEDKIRHADPIGTVELTCPACTVPRQMTCYRFSGGLFGNRKALHFVCPTCGGTWTVDKSDSDKILASMKPTNDGEQGVS
jgi:Zn-finger nucleic acid-binding protein